MANTLFHDIHHHAKDKKEIALTLMAGFATRLNPPKPGQTFGWQILRGNVGNNSWRMYLPGSKPVRMWFFTGYEHGVVKARNAYYWADVTESHRITSRVEALRFIEHVRANTP